MKKFTIIVAFFLALCISLPCHAAVWVMSQEDKYEEGNDKESQCTYTYNNNYTLSSWTSTEFDYSNLGKHVTKTLCTYEDTKMTWLMTHYLPDNPDNINHESESVLVITLMEGETWLDINLLWQERIFFKEVTRDYKNDGTIDQMSIYTHEGNVTTVRENYFNEPERNKIIITTYNEYDLPINVKEDKEQDGTIDKEWNISYTYNSRNNPITETQTYLNGSIKKIIDYKYNEHGNIIEESSGERIAYYTWIDLEESNPNPDLDPDSDEESDDNGDSGGCFISTILGY